MVYPRPRLRAGLLVLASASLVGCDGVPGRAVAPQDVRRVDASARCVVTPAGIVLDGKRARDCSTAISKAKVSSPPPPAEVVKEPAPEAQLDAEHAVGQLVVTRISGTAPSASLLERVRAGRVGGVILFRGS